jgi:Tfp pilus assembly protein PilF
MSASFSPDGSRVQISGRDATIWDLLPDRRNLGVLESIAHWLSGHELVATQLVPIPVDRLLGLASDSGLVKEMKPTDARKWRWTVANQHLTQRNWSAAETELSRLTQDPQSIWELRAARGHALAELGRWHDAARAFQSAIDRRPDSTELSYYKALASAAGGEASAIDNACANALQKHGATQNPDRAHWLASLCVLAGATDDATRARVARLARLASELEPDLERFVSVYAGALLRAEEPSRAAALLEEVLERPVVTDRGAGTLLLLSLAQRTLGQLSASARTLGRFDSSPLRAAMPWHQRFEAELWHRELNPPR